MAVDAMGGDNAPGCVIEGTELFLKQTPEAEILLFGAEDRMKPLVAALGVKDRITVVDAPEEITMHDEPMMAVRRKQNSSLVMGLKAVKDGRAQGFVSAGSTGAIFIGSMVTLKMLKDLYFAHAGNYFRQFALHRA